MRDVIRIDIAGNIQAVGCDELNFTIFGDVKVRRLTDAYFSEVSQHWAIFYAGTAEVINSGFSTRAEALWWEAEWAAKQLRENIL